MDDDSDSDGRVKMMNWCQQKYVDEERRCLVTVTLRYATVNRVLVADKMSHGQTRQQWTSYMRITIRLQTDATVSVTIDWVRSTNVQQYWPRQSCNIYGRVASMGVGRIILAPLYSANIRPYAQAHGHLSIEHIPTRDILWRLESTEIRFHHGTRVPQTSQSDPLHFYRAPFPTQWTHILSC